MLIQMKIIKKIALTLCVIAVSSCSLNLQEDPNAVQPDQVLPDLLLNTMQANVGGLFSGASGTGMAMTRLQNAGSSLYRTSTTPEGFNGLWSNAYANILQDANQLITLADENGYARHAGMARVMQAYTILLLVDYFGDVPFSEAFQGAANFNPAVDSGADLYAYAISALDQAKLDLSTNPTTSLPAGYLNPVAPVVTDMYYSNNYTKWIKLANTLKLKAYLNLSLVDPSTATTNINALVADVSPTGGLMTTADENFIFRYGTVTSDPDARHPNFVGQYPAGGGAYQSNWLMWHMFFGYDATQNGAPGDPRIRFYFARQVTANSTSSNEIRCLTESLPSHYPTATASAIVDNSIAGRPPMGVAPAHPTNDPTDPAWQRTFCYPTDRGYWGRDHVDPQGIPPDNNLRTAWGPYPVGGRFDNNAGGPVGATQGQRGAGFQPIMMRSYVQFMLSEAALTLTLAGPTTARQYYNNGLNYSFTDVRNWAVNGTYNTSTVSASPTEAATINAFYPAGTYTTDVAAYVASALAAFDNRLLVSASEALNYVAREYWIASFGNGVEAYNLYRRTGKPTGMQPVINPQPGEFPQSFWYPANFANLNSSVEQKPGLSIPVFWDTNTTNLDF
jgi:hypothetical protein